MTTKAEQKLRTHEAILRSAARLLRSRGIAGARVADVMGAAGLTVGGFYAHFASKEALVDAALQRTCAELRTELFAGLENKAAAERIDTIVKRYLSVTHRDYPEGGCAMATVTGELALSAAEHRDAFARQVEAFVDELVQHLPPGAAPRRLVAYGILATFLGGIGLARALRGTELSAEILKASRAFVRAGLAADRAVQPSRSSSQGEPS